MSANNLEEVFRTSLRFWGGLTEAERESVLSNASFHSYAPGVYILNATSEDCPGLQVLMRGTVRVFISSHDGKQLTLQRTIEGQAFSIGQSCVLDRAIYEIGLVTETECEFALIPRDVCIELYNANIGVMKVFADEIARDFSKVISVLEFVAFSGMKQRLANALVERSLLAGALSFRATHSSIAADIGSMRETVSRGLYEFRRRGWVELQKGMVTINDVQALIALRGQYNGNINELLYPRAT